MPTRPSIDSSSPHSLPSPPSSPPPSPSPNMGGDAFFPKKLKAVRERRMGRPAVGEGDRDRDRETRGRETEGDCTGRRRNIGILYTARETVHRHSCLNRDNRVLCCGTKTGRESQFDQMRRRDREQRAMRCNTSRHSL
eukprot:709315-Hanusia_phi.AAC.1